MAPARHRDKLGRLFMGIMGSGCSRSRIVGLGSIGTERWISRGLEGSQGRIVRLREELWSAAVFVMVFVAVVSDGSFEATRPLSKAFFFFQLSFIRAVGAQQRRGAALWAGSVPARVGAYRVATASPPPSSWLDIYR